MIFDSFKALQQSIDDTSGHQRLQARWQVLLGLLGPIAFAVLLPTPAAALRAVWSVSQPIAVMETLALLALTSIVWGLAAWALIIASATVALRAGGLPQKWATKVLRRFLPVATRRLVTLAAGVSVISGLGACASPGELTLAASASSATSVTMEVDAAETTSDASHIDLDWLVEPLRSGETPTPLPASDLPTPSARGTPAEISELLPPATHMAQRLPDPVIAVSLSGVSTGPATSSIPDVNHVEPATAPPILSANDGESATEATGSANPAATVTVAPGDCLWTIAAQHLPQTASAAETAAATTAWYEANLKTIGPDANLLLPGQVLTIPTR